MVHVFDFAIRPLNGAGRWALLCVHKRGHTLCVYICPFIVILLPSTDTSVGDIEETFKSFTNRNDIAVVLINQHVM